MCIEKVCVLRGCVDRVHCEGALIASVCVILSPSRQQVGSVVRSNEHTAQPSRGQFNWLKSTKVKRGS